MKIKMNLIQQTLRQLEEQLQMFTQEERIIQLLKKMSNLILAELEAKIKVDRSMMMLWKLEKN
jgi:hypothetical protein